MSTFAKGDRVAWHHVFSTQHAEGSIVREDVLPADVEVGEVLGVANEEGTHFTVQFEDETRVLTEDELVRYLPVAVVDGDTDDDE